MRVGKAIAISAIWLSLAVISTALTGDNQMLIMVILPIGMIATVFIAGAE